MLLFSVFACVSGTARLPYTAETPVAELDREEREEICETQLERTEVLELTQCGGEEVDPDASLQECTSIVLELLEECGLAVGDFEDCVTEMLDDPCALFELPPPEGCAPLVECLYVPE